MKSLSYSRPEPDDDDTTSWRMPVSTMASQQEPEMPFSDLLRASMLLQPDNDDLKAGDLCPRCLERAQEAEKRADAANPKRKRSVPLTRPGKLHANADGDLTCFSCGHVVYRQGPRGASHGSQPGYR